MKLVLYIKNNDLPHRKNYDAIQRMCKSCSIELEITGNLERLGMADYDI